MMLVLDSEIASVTRLTQCGLPSSWPWRRRGRS
jgi:hypothetical protein